MAKEIQKNEEFINLIKEKINNYIKLKNMFSNLEFNNILLVNTLPSNTQEMEGKKERDNNIILSKYSRAVNEIFLKVMGPFEAGKNYSKIYETIYAYASPEDNEYEKYIYLKDEDVSILRENNLIVPPVNLDEKYTKKILIEFCNRAIEIKKNFHRLNNANFSKFFLLGDIGIGKTAFLNNIFSRYHFDLKSNDIFWVRVDLTKYHFRQRTLLNSLDFQMTKIFRGYYFDNLSEYEKHNFKMAISKYYMNNGVLNENEFDCCYKKFCDVYKRENTESFDKRIEQGIKDYIEKNFGVVYIFDGLDRIDADISIFKNKLEDIKNILSNEKYHGIFIFVMRYVSHHDYLESLLLAEKLSQTSLRNGTKLFKIIPPKLDEIITKRIDLLFSNRDEYFKIIRGNLYIKFEKDLTVEEINDVNNIGNKISRHTKNNYESYLNVFLMFLYNGITKTEPNILRWERREVFTELKNLFGYNYRKLLEIIQASNKIFLDVIGILRLQIDDIFEIGNAINNENMESYTNYKKNLDNILSKSYRILDFLLLRGSNHFKNPYQYEYSSDKKINWEKNSNLVRLVPYLYNLYYPVNVKNKIEEKYYLLLKIRILQYISIYNNIYNFDTILNFLHENFHYSKDRINIAFNEMLEWGLITNDIQSDNTSYTYIYKLSRAGEYHLETLIYEFSYIRIIIDDLLVPEQFNNYIIENNNREFINKRVEEIIGQFPKIINFITMINILEQKEMNYSNINEDEKPKWNIYNKLYEKTIEIFAKILWVDDHSLTLLDSVLSIK